MDFQDTTVDYRNYVKKQVIAHAEEILAEMRDNQTNKEFIVVFFPETGTISNQKVDSGAFHADNAIYLHLNDVSLAKITRDLLIDEVDFRLFGNGEPNQSPFELTRMGVI